MHIWRVTCILSILRTRLWQEKGVEKKDNWDCTLHGPWQRAPINRSFGGKVWWFTSWPWADTLIRFKVIFCATGKNLDQSNCWNIVSNYVQRSFFALALFHQNFYVFCFFMWDKHLGMDFFQWQFCGLVSEERKDWLHFLKHLYYYSSFNAEESSIVAYRGCPRLSSYLT